MDRRTFIQASTLTAAAMVTTSAAGAGKESRGCWICLTELG